MASYSLHLSRSAERELREIPKPDLGRVWRRIRTLEGTPRPPGCMKLAGAEGYRIRQGDWRVIYQVDDETEQVSVVKIGHRREVYR